MVGKIGALNMTKRQMLMAFLSSIFTKAVVAREQPFSNDFEKTKMLLVLCAPSIHDKYYAPVFKEIVKFQIDYIKAILGKDNVVLIVNEDTVKYYENHLPDDIFIVEEVYDIWMRDFTTVNPQSPVQFTYTWASMTKTQSKEVQNSFHDFAQKYKLQREFSDYRLDGGNIVDNYNGKVITTTRFLQDNGLKMEAGKTALKQLLNAKEVAIVEADEDVLAHSDGIVSFIDDNVLLVNDYKQEKAYREKLLSDLKSAFPTTKIIEVPVEYQESTKQEYADFSSACGVNLNAVVTHNYIYVPTFNMLHDKKVLDIIKANTSKKVIAIPAQGVCYMGGSVRCLSWQLQGENANKLIKAAR
jgi:agmatine/peptidylarginine deiminase